MSDIFISYAREDIAVARQLAEALDGHGWSTFWDRRTPVGSIWEEYIEEELKTARGVLVVWSGSSIKSRYVRE